MSSRILRVSFVVTVALSLLSCGEGPISRLLDIDPPYEFTSGVADDSPGTGSIDEASTTANGSYRQGTTITATAAADSGSYFLEWVDASAGGATVSGENPCEIALTSDLDLRVRFGDNDPPYELVVGTSTNSTGSGSMPILTRRPRGRLAKGRSDCLAAGGPTSQPSARNPRPDDPGRAVARGRAAGGGPLGNRGRHRERIGS